MKNEELKDKSAIRMIDVSGKEHSLRIAVASVKVCALAATIRKIKNGKLPKGDCLNAARVAGILAAKNTALIIPLCHPLQIAYSGVDFKFLVKEIVITATVKANYATGVEMEALTACAVAALTIYDMAKTEEKGIVISDLKLLKKTGGKSDYRIKNR